MRVLGLDTATRATAVAVLDTETGTTVERRDDPPAGARPRHTTRLLALVARALADAHLDWGGLDLIAVGVGPGTFTGMRIGIATARALARTRGLPITGVSTLQALAAAAARSELGGEAPVLAVLDARRHEVFAAAWPAAEAGRAGAQALLAPSALAPSALPETLAGLRGPAAGAARPWLAVGDGALLSRAELAAAGAQIPEDDSPLHRVSAVAVCRLAAGAPSVDADAVLPDYVREPDAVPARSAVPAPETVPAHDAVQTNAGARAR